MPAQGMENRYFIMAMDERPGCPTGFYQSILATSDCGPHDEYGLLPWYAGPRRYGGQIAALPEEGLVLIEKRDYRYDVRAGSPFFYVLSRKFSDCLGRIRHSFFQVKEVECVDADGRPRPDRQVAIAVPRKFLQRDCLEPGPGASGAAAGLEGMQVRSGFGYDLFDARDIPVGHASLICSEKARQVFEEAGVHGVRYIALPDANAAGALDMGELYRPIGLYDPV